MQTKSAMSEIRRKPTERDPSALGGSHARSTLADIERAEGEGMSTTGGEGAGESNRDIARHLVREQELTGQCMVFDLAEASEELAIAPGTAQNARTLAKLGGLRLVLMKLVQGKALERHSASHQMTIHTITGHVVIHVDGAELDMPAGNVVVLERDVTHDIVAQEDSTVLVTVSGPTAHA